MLHLKPKEKIEKRFRFEMYFELLIVFMLGCIIFFVLPFFLGVKNSGIRNNDSYFSLIDYLYNKHHFYPFVSIGGLIICTVYYFFQRKEQKLIELIDEETTLSLVCRNSFTGKISERRVTYSNLEIKKKLSKTGDDFYKIYQNNVYICSFYPKTKPWNLKYDSETITNIIDVLSKIQTDLRIALNITEEIQSRVSWFGFINLLFPLFLIIPFIISCNSFLSVSVLVLIALIVEYLLLQSVVKVRFNNDTIFLFWYFRFFLRNSEHKYTDVIKVSYCYYSREGEMINLYVKKTSGKVKKVSCRFENKETSLKVLRRLQINEISIDFKGFDQKQQKNILHEIAMIEIK